VFRVELSDPSTHQKYFCLTETHVCMLEDYTGPAAAFAQPAGVQRDDYGTLTREDLGRNFNGLNAVGTRETRVLNSGAIGNDRPLSIVKEFWFSPQVGIKVSVKRVDPRHSTEVFNVTEVNLTEPATTSSADKEAGQK